MPTKTLMLTACVVAATISVAFAGDGALPARYHGPTPDDGLTSAAPTPDQEDAVPYHPCRLALGWRNGHLVCDNRS
jgi:hypothetical protein